MTTRFQGGPLDGKYIDTGKADSWEATEQVAAPIHFYNPELPPSSTPQVERVFYARHRRKHPGGRIEQIFCLVDEEPSWEVPPRNAREICDAIKFVEGVMAQPAHSRHYPDLVAICPTIIDGLGELLETREGLHRLVTLRVDPEWYRAIGDE